MAIRRCVAQDEEEDDDDDAEEEEGGGEEMGLRLWTGRFLSRLQVRAGGEWGCGNVDMHARTHTPTNQPTTPNTHKHTQLQAMAAAEEQTSSSPPSPTTTSPNPPLLLTRLLHAALVPYAAMVEGWVERGDPGDTRGESERECVWDVR